LKADRGDAVQQALRPYATVGVALVGAGLIAITPMAPRLPDTYTVQDIKLVSGEDAASDLSTPWIDQFNTASDNSTTLLNTFYDAPYIGLQQPIANLSGFLQGFFESPTSGTVTDVMGQMQDNLAAVLTGFGLQNATTGLNSTTATVLLHTLASDHGELFSQVPGYIPAGEQAEIIPIINFLASPASGILMGDLGPFISPFVALINSIGAGDDLNTTLADMYGAFFNGADLDLNSLTPLINGLDLFPQGMEMTSLDFAFGGLLTPGDTTAGIGGSLFNSVGLFFSGVPSIDTLGMTSHAVGPIGAWEEWGQTIASLLGWDGSGSPLSDVTLPVIPTDFFDGSTIPAAATDLSSLWQDLAAAF
jgi:hypothetical protein